MRDLPDRFFDPRAAMTQTIAMFLPSLEGGGAERVYAQLAGRFAAQGYRVQLLLAAARGPYVDEVEPSVEVVDLRAPSVSRSAAGLARHLKRAQPQVLLSALDHANVVAFVANLGNRRRCPHVMSVRAVPSVVYNHEGSPKRRLLQHGMRVAFRFADRVIANSQAISADLRDNYGVPETKLKVIYNPLDLAGIDRQSRMPCRAIPRAFEQTPIVLSVGSLTPLKDYPTLLRAFSLARKEHRCALVVLGEGPERGRLEQLAGVMDVRDWVRLPGFDANPFACMRRADVFVSSSLTEGCPNAVMQALACNLPVVATDCVGGTAEVLASGRWGRLVPVGDSLAMADAIVATLSDSHSIDGRRRAQDFGLDGIAERYLRVLADVGRP